MTELSPAEPDQRRALALGATGLAVLALVLVGGLLWAKWLPYSGKIAALADSRTWSGSPLLGVAGEPGSAPSWSGAWDFSVQYFEAVWKAALVAVLVAAALDSLVPRRWLLRVVDRRTRVGQSMAGGALALPAMMCTCCTAPIAVGLRRRGAPLAASIAYWLGNPLLNPAVIVFLLLVVPWQYAVVRIVVGGVLVVGVSAGVARRVDDTSEMAARVLAPDTGADDVVPRRWPELPVAFGRSLLRFLAVIVPEYAVVVFLTGLLTPMLSDFAGTARELGVFAVVLAALVGTLLVIPTGGEIPVLVALAASGTGLGVAGALLIALPALSAPSIAMVGRALSWRATALVTAAVVAAAVVAGGLLSVVG